MIAFKIRRQANHAVVMLLNAISSPLALNVDKKSLNPSFSIKVVDLASDPTFHINPYDNMRPKLAG
jgi:hypothetical protein